MRAKTAARHAEKAAIPPRRRVGPRLAWAFALIAAIAPLWSARNLPFVDLPQHLYLISILHRLHDATTLYPRFFELRPGLAPYLGYYHLVNLLAFAMPIELANRLFLTGYVVSFPLGLAFLLRSLGKPSWPALLAIPFAYGDSLGWGFINYCAALPPTFLAAGLFLRALTDAGHRRRWAILLALSLLGVLSLHPLPMAFLALALPWLLLTTRVPEDGGAAGLLARLRPRLPALLGVLPALAFGIVWALSLTSPSAPAAYGVPHRSWGALLARENLEFETFGNNLGTIPWLLGNILNDGSDQWGPRSAEVVGILAAAVSLFARPAPLRPKPPLLERLRPAGLCTLAFVLFFTLPLNVHGRIYYLSPRFVHLGAGLALGLVPRLDDRWARRFLWMGALAALATALPLAVGFAAFDREARSLQVVAGAAGDRPTVMGLIFDTRSRIVHHPVYVHSAATLARERGGVPNYCFALEPHELVRYRTAPLPSFPSEWEPGAFDYEAQGRAYDHFLLRGADPAKLFGSRLGGELYVAARSGEFTLVRRRLPAAGGRRPGAASAPAR